MLIENQKVYSGGLSAAFSAWHSLGGFDTFPPFTTLLFNNTLIMAIFTASQCRQKPISLRMIVQCVGVTLLLLGSVDGSFMPRGGIGMLKMCPPGGEAFANAWQMTCGMRRKRSVETGAAPVVQPQPEPTDGSSPNNPLIPAPHQSHTNDVIMSEKIAIATDAPLRLRRSSKTDASKSGYRPLSMTEMMHFCCRYGCTFRDLLPYCDPFGTWDS
uniref:IlGF domain-containing protein n=1 Tax=Panagrellus redivivus TaxID=6233 RepID=A0A7E4V6F2_PANRE